MQSPCPQSSCSPSSCKAQQNLCTFHSDACLLASTQQGEVGGCAATDGGLVAAAGEHHEMLWWYVTSGWILGTICSPKELASTGTDVELGFASSSCFVFDPQEFILSCLTLNPDKRPTANSLLFHRVLFEVHSLKLLAAHCFINNQCE